VLTLTFIISFHCLPPPDSIASDILEITCWLVFSQFFKCKEANNELVFKLDWTLLSAFLFTNDNFPLNLQGGYIISDISMGYRNVETSRSPVRTFVDCHPDGVFAV
jgi:hypothetical protein